MSHLHRVADAALCDLLKETEIWGQRTQPGAQLLSRRMANYSPNICNNKPPLMGTETNLGCSVKIEGSITCTYSIGLVCGKGCRFYIYEQIQSLEK